MRKLVISDNVFAQKTCFQQAAPGPQRIHICSFVRNNACLKNPGNVFTPNNNIITKVAGPQIIHIAQGVNDFRIVVSNNYDIYVVYSFPCFSILYRRLPIYYLFVWGIVFLGGGE